MGTPRASPGEVGKTPEPAAAAVPFKQRIIRWSRLLAGTIKKRHDHSRENARIPSLSPSLSHSLPPSIFSGQARIRAPRVVVAVPSRAGGLAASLHHLPGKPASCCSQISGTRASTLPSRPVAARFLISPLAVKSPPLTLSDRLLITPCAAVHVWNCRGGGKGPEVTVCPLSWSGTKSLVAGLERERWTALIKPLPPHSCLHPSQGCNLSLYISPPSHH